MAGTLTASIPCTEEIDDAGEEATFEDAQNQSKAHERLPVFDEAEPNHGCAPAESDCAEPETRSEKAGHDGGGWLAKDVCDEEDERYDGLEYSN